MNSRGDSTGVLSRQELLYLYLMVQRQPLHLGHIVAEYLRHQGLYGWISVLFFGPYIMRLIMGMGLLDAIRGDEKAIVPASLGIETMRLMGMVCRHRPGEYILITPALEIAERGEDATEGSQQVLEPQRKHTEAEAPPAA